MLKVTTGIFVFLLIASFFAAGSALASHDDHDLDSGRDFGKHVATHAQEGHFNGDMNPGVHHQGFSPWAPRN